MPSREVIRKYGRPVYLCDLSREQILQYALEDSPFALMCSASWYEWHGGEDIIDGEVVHAYGKFIRFHDPWSGECYCKLKKTVYGEVVAFLSGLFKMTKQKEGNR